MRKRAVFAVYTVAAITLLWPGVDASARARRQPAHTPPPTLEVPPETRLLVIAPHPDDETLAAGGLMQRVHESGGHVNVVYLTDGDGYPEGVQSEGHVESPSASDYRGYGRQRRREARDALAALGLDRASHTFLSFPDGGLCKLTRTYWSERRTAFRSPPTTTSSPSSARSARASSISRQQRTRS